MRLMNTNACIHILLTDNDCKAIINDDAISAMFSLVNKIATAVLSHAYF